MILPSGDEGGTKGFSGYLGGGRRCDAVGAGRGGRKAIRSAQHQPSPRAAGKVECLLGPGRSLASAGSWADDVRDDRPETYNRHFVDLALAEDRYDAAKHCHASEQGDCIVAGLERLKTELMATDHLKRDALRYAVRFVGDIHQPLHTVGEGRGGNDIAVEVRLAGAKTCRGGPCPIVDLYLLQSGQHRLQIVAGRLRWRASVLFDQPVAGQFELQFIRDPHERGLNAGEVDSLRRSPRRYAWRTGGAPRPCRGSRAGCRRSPTA